METMIVGVPAERHYYAYFLALDDFLVLVHHGFLCVILEVVMMMVMVHCCRGFVVVSCPDDAMTFLWSWDFSKRVYCTCWTTFLPRFLHWEMEQTQDFVDDDPFVVIGGNR